MFLRCVKHESHPMNQDFKVEFNYSWLAPPVDDYIKVGLNGNKLVLLDLIALQCIETF